MPPAMQPQKMLVKDVPRLLLLSQRNLETFISAELEAKATKEGLGQKYLKLKRAALSLPLGGAAKLIRAWKPDDADHLCTKIQYCERKDWFKERLSEIEEISDERIIAFDVAVGRISKIEDGPEMLRIAKDFTTEALSEFADHAIPVSLVVKMFKYGLDELCQCVDI